MWKKRDDWFWEGNIQEKLAKHFENQGYKVTVANTLAKSRGIVSASRLSVSNVNKISVSFYVLQAVV